MTALAGDGLKIDRAQLLRQLPIAIVALILCAPTLYRLGVQVWSREIGAHGPIVLATGLWLVWRKLPAMTAEAKTGWLPLTLVGMLLSLPLYVAGRAYDIISFESAGLYGFILMVLHDRFGLHYTPDVRLPVAAPSRAPPVFRPTRGRRLRAP